MRSVPAYSAVTARSSRELLVIETRRRTGPSRSREKSRTISASDIFSLSSPGDQPRRSRELHERRGGTPRLRNSCPGPRGASECFFAVAREGSSRVGEDRDVGPRARKSATCFGCRSEVVDAGDDVGDPHGDVVDDDAEVVERVAVDRTSERSRSEAPAGNSARPWTTSSTTIVSSGTSAGGRTSRRRPRGGPTSPRGSRGAAPSVPERVPGCSRRLASASPAARRPRNARHRPPLGRGGRSADRR